MILVETKWKIINILPWMKLSWEYITHSWQKYIFYKHFNKFNQKIIIFYMCVQLKQSSITFNQYSLDRA